MFGIMVSAWRGDLLFLRGLLASIRESIRDVPICIVRHGSFPIDDLNRYGVTTLDEDAVCEPLRAFSYGYGLTKMVSFWHSPYEKFLHIDADAIMYGNVVEQLPICDFDFIYNEPHETITDTIIKSQYFDSSLFDPGYDWVGYPYFNSGVFVGARGMFDVGEYLAYLEIQRRVPGSIFTDQGIINLMLFKGVSQGRFKARSWPLQAVVPVIEARVLEERFPLDGGGSERKVVHWAGPKPFVGSAVPHAALMTKYRKAHIGSPAGARFILKAEELNGKRCSQATALRGVGA